MAEPNIIYKVSVLQMLSLSATKMSTLQISNFFLEGEYTDFFTIEQTLYELKENHLISSDQKHNTTYYQITSEGIATLSSTKDKLTQELKNDIKDYLQLHEFEIKTDYSLSASYDRATGGGYIVHCNMLDETRTMIDLSFHVSSAEQAESVCNNWKAKHEDVYMALLDVLI